MSLEMMAMRWLRFKKNCPLAFFERGPRNPFGSRPDVLGVTEHRYLIEVEIKRTLSDFRANERKTHVANRAHCLPRWPKHFYFCVPKGLVEKVEPILPDYAGLLVSGDYDVHVVRPSPANNESNRLSVKDCARLFRVLGNQILSTEEKVEAFRRNSTHEPWGVEYFI